MIIQIFAVWFASRWAYEVLEAEEGATALEIARRQSPDLLVLDVISIINELLDLLRIEERRGQDFQLVRVEAGALLSDVMAN
ncbi:MAG: hypothetical protein PHV02_11520 [Rhodocyclaceae bacterium]|nr:hypothetical protein [Rhodocyclaceae bacterium]